MSPRFPAFFLASLAAGAACFFLLSTQSDLEPLQNPNQGNAPNNPNMSVRPTQTHVLPFASTVGEKLAVPESSLWKNDLNLVHIVTTRFMQHQKDLTSLIQARLDLLQTFTAPSMRQQTSDQFLWMIWTDAEAEEGSLIVESLKSMAEQQPNLVVVKGEQAKESSLRNLYGYTWTELSANIVAGDATLLADYHEASLTRLLVDTRLDSDDALSGSFIESTQAGVAAAMGHGGRGGPQHFCPDSHMEWLYYGENKNPEDADAAGGLVQYDNEAFCINSGWTTATLPEGEVERRVDANDYRNCEAHEHPPCQRSLNVDRLFDQDVVQGDKRRDLTVAQQCPDMNFKVGTDTIDSKLGGNPSTFACSSPGMTRCLDPITQTGYEWFNPETSPLTNGGALGSPSAGFNLNTPVAWPCIPDDCSSYTVDFLLTITEQKCENESAPRKCEIIGIKAEYAYNNLHFNHMHIGTALMKQGKCNLGDDPRFDYALTNADGVKYQWEGFGGAPGVVDEFTFETACDKGLSHLRLCVARVDEHPECKRRLQLLPEQDKQDDTTTYSTLARASVLLARTPTAAGMKNVLPGKKGGGERSKRLTDVLASPEQQDEGWDSVETHFGLSKNSVVELRQRMEANMEKILVDAFTGQCTPGHSCKESTKKALGYLLDKVYHDRV